MWSARVLSTSKVPTTLDSVGIRTQVLNNIALNIEPDKGIFLRGKYKNASLYLCMPLCRLLFKLSATIWISELQKLQYNYIIQELKRPFIIVCQILLINLKTFYLVLNNQ